MNIYKIFLSIKNFLFAFCLKEYLVKLENYYYCAKKRSYLLVLRIRHKKIFCTIDIDTVCNDFDMISMLHPIDSYIIGVIHGISKNNIIFEPNIMNYFCNYESYKVIDPFLKLEGYYNNSATLRNIKDNSSIKIPTIDFLQNPFLFYSIGNIEANKLGFFMSEEFITNLN